MKKIANKTKILVVTTILCAAALLLFTVGPLASHKTDEAEEAGNLARHLGR